MFLVNQAVVDFSCSVKTLYPTNSVGKNYITNLANYLGAECRYQTDLFYYLTQLHTFHYNNREYYLNDLHIYEVLGKKNSKWDGLNR